MPTLDELIRLGRLEPVAEDPVNAIEMLAEAARNLQSARAIQGSGDNSGAYSLAYDSARKAVTAHMMRHGFRANPNDPGHHRTIGLYAVTLFPNEPSMNEFDLMRRRRNNAEYRVHQLSDRELQYAIDAASRIVAAVVKESGEWSDAARVAD